ncbi:DUF6461 domain-containing protein [Streptomyces sp. NPDC088354]|uniref:DUF6461 domain-containing protein n=1 Tax=Streptomyces sp. NPDC088354 TaxID=3365856 RepID=UPI0037FE36B6
MQSPKDWEWLFNGRYLGFTVTFTRDISPEGLLSKYGADLAAAHMLSFSDMHSVLQPGLSGAVLRVGDFKDWSFAIEAFGIKGMDATLLEDLSRDSETFAVHSGANALDLMEHWRAGRPLEKFEPGNPMTLRASGSHPFWDATERLRKAYPGVMYVVAAMGSIGEHIGGSLSRAVDDGELLSVALPQFSLPPGSFGTPLPLVHPPEGNPSLGRRLPGSIRPDEIPPPYPTPAASPRPWPGKPGP